jgi:putative redox protein
MTLIATTRRVANGLEHEVDVNQRHVIVTDEPESLGGTDQGPAPHELLPAALASCVATMVAIYAERRGWDIGEPSVEVRYETDSTPRSMDVTVHLPDHLTAEQLRRLKRVAETCPLRRALEAGFTFEDRVVTAQCHRPR